MKNNLPGNLAFVCILLNSATSFGQDVRSNSQIGFNDQIRPILSEYCFACHGPDSASRKADLRLDSRQSALDAGAVEPGKPNESELIARILSDDPDTVMPPPTTGKTLKPEEKLLLCKWIEAGAEWEAHWAFIKPTRPKVPNEKLSFSPSHQYGTANRVLGRFMVHHGAYSWMDTVVGFSDLHSSRIFPPQRCSVASEQVP